MLLKLLFELYDMLENEFLFGGILAVGDGRWFLLFEFSTAFEFLVYNVLPPLEELQQLVVHFRLHLKIYNWDYVSLIEILALYFTE